MARNLYLPSLLQQEFFHDHFARNKHLKLEEKSFAWHERKDWPKDFVGRFEADYFQEAVYKRLKQQAKPSWAGYFINRSTAPSVEINPKDLVGHYSVEKPEDGWFSGQIIRNGDKLTWKNDKGGFWGLKLKPGGLLEWEKPSNTPKQSDLQITTIRKADGLPGPSFTGFKLGDSDFWRK